MKFNKSQAAMEFLMTYGWAILVVLVAIGALAYFGVLSPDQFLPSKCVLPAGIACVDFQMAGSADTVTLVLRNGLGADLTDVRLATGTCTDSPLGVNINNGDQGTVIATVCTITEGAKFNEDVTITYTNSDSGLTKTVTGTLTGRVEP